MNSIYIKGNGSLAGEVTVQGSKNAALPILAATIMLNGVSTIRNCPHISDVECMLGLLRCLGCKTVWEKEELLVDSSNIRKSILPGELVTCMRSSVMLLGPLLAVCREATMNYPGGCVIGERPIDIHLQVLGKLGAVFNLEKDSVRGRAPLLKGCDITLRFPSVGATENAVMAAVLAEGTTVLHNCAREPEIRQLCEFLKNAGAQIYGVGESKLIINGVKELKPACYTIEPDRIVAGTYLLSVAATGGSIRLCNAISEDMTAVIDVARRLGCEVRNTGKILHAERKGQLLRIPYIKTMIYPGFPTDLQSILMVTLALADGESIVEESIFSDRFKIVGELIRMGADIVVKQNRVYIRGVKNLFGRQVTASDLRGGAALVLAGITAQGDTIVRNCNYIERGYEDICRDYGLLGANLFGIG